MIYARQQQYGPPWEEETRNSVFSSIYAAQSSQTASSNPHYEGEQSSDDDDDNDGDTATGSGIPLRQSTSRRLESSAQATASATDEAAQSNEAFPLTLTSPTTQPTTDQWTSPSMTTSIAWTRTPWRSGWHSYAPTSTDASGSTFTDSAGLNPGLDTQEKSHRSANTAMIAGVVVPIVILLASGLVFLSCVRRRRRRAAVTATPTTNEATEATAMIEKVSKKVDMNANSSAPPTTMLSPIDEALVMPQRPQLVITSPQNPTYFTGLDTFSVHSAGTSEDPPPPYRARSVLSNRSSDQNQRGGVNNNITLPPVSPVSPIAHLSSPFSDANALTVMRSPSQRSFASTLYSSNASVYEARPARRSTGPAEYMIDRRSSAEEHGRVRSPFEDPEEDSDSEGRGNDR